MTIKIIDNFLPESVAEEVRSNFFNNEFPWFILKNSVENEYDNVELKDINGNAFVNSIVFRHWFVIEKNINSGLFGIIEPLADRLIDYLNKDIVLRNCAANLLTPNSEILGRYSSPHVDVKYSEEEYEKYDTYTGLYYVNSEEGDTVLYNELHEGKNNVTNFTPKMIVSPEANKMVFWNSKRYHSAPAGSSGCRSVINFNFYVEK